MILEETSYKPRTLVQWLFYIDRRHVFRIKDLHPLHGVLLARMYRYEILNKTFKRIREKLPLEIMLKLVSQDHALIYLEAWTYSEKLGIISNAIYHVEPESLKQVVRKFYRYGITEMNLTQYYPELSKKKIPRKPGLHPDSLASIMLWTIKAIAYTLGRIKTL